MRECIAVTLAVLGLAGCAGEPGPGNWQNTVNEATPTTGSGNTGAAGTAAAGPSLNSQSRTEAGREAAAR